MDHDLDYYVSNLEPKTQLYSDSLGIFEQSIIYPDKPNPLKEACRSPVVISSNNRVQKYTNTFSLWSSVAEQIDTIHNIQTPTMKKQNIQFLTDTLKNYLSDKSVHMFLTGRRVYPIMELLDKPKLEFENKHQNALGYFLSFLFNESIYVVDTIYRWSSECSDGSTRLLKNNDGYWFIDKN